MHFVTDISVHYNVIYNSRRMLCPTQPSTYWGFSYQSIILIRNIFCPTFSFFFSPRHAFLKSKIRIFFFSYRSWSLAVVRHFQYVTFNCNVWNIYWRTIIYNIIFYAHKKKFQSAKRLFYNFLIVFNRFLRGKMKSQSL